MKKFIVIMSIVTIIYITVKIIQRIKRMKPNKGIQQSTLDVIKKHEGVRNEPYKDTRGIDTIGVGHVLLPHESGTTYWSDEVIDKVLKSDLQKCANEIKRSVKVPLNQNQFDALCSLIFNIGVGAFRNSTLLKYLNKNEKPENISSAWLAWSKQKELKPRRQKEVNLFFS